MEHIHIFLNYIGKTNLFNFIIFLSIFVLILKKIKFSERLDNNCENIKLEVDASKKEKEKSEESLQKIQNSLSNIEDDIEQIIQKSNENLNNVKQKITDTTQLQIQSLRENVDKSIEKNYISLKNELINRSARAAVEIAKEHIINELNTNKELHEKFITESLEALNGVNLE